MIAAQAASAATITVNTTADNLTAGDGQCTLREALGNVNAAADTTSGDCAAGSGAGDTVAFNLTLPARTKSATIKLTLGELNVNRDVSIIGPGAVSLHVSGGHISRIFRVTAGTTGSVSDLTMEQAASRDPSWYNGWAPGGAIVNSGNLTLTNCTLTHNKSREGGGVLNEGTMTLINSTLDHNRAAYGGAAISNSGTMTLTNCTLKSNVFTWFKRDAGYTAGGISNDGMLTLTGCTLDGNRGIHGGAIINTAGGPYFKGGLTLINCTLTHNYARGGAGGGIDNNGAMTLTNCTIARNRAWTGRGSLGGGGIWQYPADQDPGGVGGTAEVTNTIIAGNGKGRDCGGDRPTSNGHNLDGDGTCFTGGGTDLVNTDPLLAPPANYGGATETFALCTAPGVPKRACTGASPALDAGDDAVADSPLNLTTDQRGLPRLSGAHVDIGAYEAQQ
jgi:CSLREA domain-containing protein